MIRNVTVLLTFPDGSRKDISGIVRAGSVSITNQLFNENKTSCVDTASMEVKHDRPFADLLKSTNRRIKVQISNRETGAALFTGVMEPGFTQQRDDHLGDIRLEAVDNTYLLDEKTTEDLVYEDYPVCDPAAPARSLFHTLIQKAGYVPSDIGPVDAVPAPVKCVYLTRGQDSYRSILDTLLSEYLYVLTTDANGKIITRPWTKKQFAVDINVSGNKSTVVPFAWQKKARYTDGVEIEWAKTSEIKGALLYRDAPSVSSSLEEGTFPGVGIAAGDYYPKDSDIQEIYQTYNSQWLDIPYNSRTSRLKNDDLSLLNSKNHIVEWDADADISIDVQHFEGRRARIAFKNNAAPVYDENGDITDAGTRYLRYFEIRGDALIRSSKVKIAVPGDAVTRDSYTSTCLFDADSAGALADAKAADNLYSDFEYSFGLNDLVDVGIVAFMRDDSGIDTAALLYKREITVGNPVYKYGAIGINEYNEMVKHIEETAGSLRVNESIIGPPGDPGLPATIYQLLTGVSVIKRYNTGVIDPPAVTCIQQAITGDSPPVPSDKTLKYATSKSGTETPYTEPVTVGDWDWIEFRLYDGDTLLDRERIPVLSDGPPATVYHLVPSVPMIVRDAAGEARPSEIACSQQVVTGGSPPEPSDKTIKYITSANENETAYTGPVAVAWDWIEFRLYDGQTLLDSERVFVLSEGEPSKTYELQPGASVIRVYDGVTEPYRISCAQVSITGSGLPVPSDKTLRYAASFKVIVDSAIFEILHYPGDPYEPALGDFYPARLTVEADELPYTEEITVNPLWDWIEFRLYDGDVLLDKERVPVLADGAAPVYLDLANQNITVRADEYGEPYSLPVTTQAVLYNGNTPVTYAAFKANVAAKNIVYYPGDIFDPMLDGFYPVRAVQWNISRGSIDQNGIITIAELPEDKAEITVRAFYDGVEYSAVLTLVKVKDGEAPVIIDIENENTSIPCDSYGVPYPGELPLVTKAVFYKGTERVSPFWYLGPAARGISIAQDGTITVAENAELERANNILVLAAYRGNTYTRMLTITKTLEGFSATVYELLPGANVIKRDAAGNNTPEAINCAQQKIVGNNAPVPSDKILKYITSASSTETAYTGPVTVGTLSWIEFRLYDGQALLDSERIPVLSDGTNGTNGDNSITVDIENENTSVNCDAYGVPYPGALPLTTKAALYDGTTPASAAWSLEAPPSVVSIASDGTITVASNAALGNLNRIKVKAVYKDVTYTRMFTVGKTLDGESPITLNLLPDNEVIQCDHLGNPLRGLPFTAKAMLYKGTLEINAAMEVAEAARVDIVYYPGNLFDPMPGGFYPTLGYPVVWTLTGAPGGVTIDRYGLITVSGTAQLSDVNSITVKAAYHGKTYEAVFGVTKVRGGTPGTPGKDGKDGDTGPQGSPAPRYRGVTSIADTGNTGKVTLKLGGEITAEKGDWVAYVGTTVDTWQKGYCMRWNGTGWEAIPIDGNGNFDTNPYVAAQGQRI
ncbi:MAG: hypothetical protein LBG26_02245 [Treponema sp.]|jgi:hypothetical protein|nr:hypothetical protein [Treponema sp.]